MMVNGQKKINCEPLPSLPRFCGTKTMQKKKGDNSFIVVVTSLQNFWLQNNFKMVDATILSDWVVCTSRISWRKTYKSPFPQTRHGKKAKQRVVKDVNSTIFWFQWWRVLVAEDTSVISFFSPPEAFANSSSEMSRVLCDFTLSLISPAVSLCWAVLLRSHQ